MVVIVGTWWQGWEYGSIKGMGHRVVSQEGVEGYQGWNLETRDALGTPC